jgi:hypothetical protein
MELLAWHTVAGCTYGTATAQSLAACIPARLLAAGAAHLVHGVKQLLDRGPQLHPRVTLQHHGHPEQRQHLGRGLARERAHGVLGSLFCLYVQAQSQGCSALKTPANVVCPKQTLGYQLGRQTPLS